MSLTTELRVREAGAADLARWDELSRGFPGHRVTHTRAWVESLQASGCGTPLYLMFERGGAVVGCMPGLVSEVGPFKLFGSPRQGWQTISMGPAFDPRQVTTAELTRALVPYLEREQGVSQIELMQAGLDPDAMRAAGFEGESVITYKAPLFPGDEKKTFRQLKDSARRNVQRAQRLGLEVRFEDDAKFVDTHYTQLLGVFKRRAAAIPYTKQRIQACVDHLKAAGNLIALAVYLPGSQVCIATGTFFVDNGELSLWQWAHVDHYRWYRATELMTWTAIQRAMAMGCDRFDLMGSGDFKAKFGAEPDSTKVRWLRSRPQWLATARSAAAAGFHAQQSLRGTLRRQLAQIAQRFTGRAATAPAVVMGDIDLVQALGLGGITSVVHAPPRDAARYSRSTVEALPFFDPYRQPDELIDGLIAYAQAQPEPPALFYQDDRGLLLVSRNRDRLKGAFRFVVPDADLVEALVDKGRFQKLAHKHKLPVPPGRVFETGKMPQPDASSIAYPAILKPITRRNDLWNPLAGGAKAVRLDGPADLEALWPKLAAADATVLVQTCIPGTEREIVSYHTYVDDKGIVADFTGRKIRTWPVEYGDSCSVEISDAPDVTALGRDICRKLRLKGVAKMDFKRAPDGTLYLLEINARFTLWHHLGARAGMNIPALVYGDLLGRPRPTIAAARAGARWCRLWVDYKAARVDGIGFLSWLPWALRCEAKRALALNDPFPLIGAALGRWSRDGATRRAQPSPYWRVA